ncbi:cytochrome P450 [Nemania sp. FL0916]|nr:cytochrome P450 [Nemania sp. FL0916]
MAWDLNYNVFLFSNALEPSFVRILILSVTLAVLGWWVVLYWTSPLREYPGPFLAGCTNWWRFAQVLTGRYHLYMRELHVKYGPIVRIGPNLLDIDILEVIKTVYGSDTSWRKTEFYQNNSAFINGKTTFTLFSEVDPVNHARLQRPMAKFFSHGKEIFVDKVLENMCQQLTTAFNAKVCDLGEWFTFCTWDILGMLVLGQPFGYVENGYDVDGTLRLSRHTIDYFAAVGQMPFLDYLLDKNPLIRLGPPNLGNLTRIATEHLSDRLRRESNHAQSDVPDFLQHFIDAKNSHPEVTELDVLILSINTLVAGADSTAITLRSVFYYSLRNPNIYNRLEREILAADVAQLVSYRVSRAMPYLEATIREAMRFLPAISMPLERYVPEPGLRLPDGKIIPAGTAVGVNAYIIGRNEKVWGPDADEFRPERWLKSEHETESSYQSRVQLYNTADLSFGHGARMCIGRHVANMELYKIVATLISRFEIKLANPDREWKLEGSWFPLQQGLLCRLKRRV